MSATQGSRGRHCKLLKDPDLRGLLLLPQGGFIQPYEFSVGGSMGNLPGAADEPGCLVL